MIRKVFRLLSEVRKNPYFGFIQGHEHLSLEDLAEIQKWVGSDNLEIIEEFEQRFAEIIGDGQTVSFAAGRMGFYALMQVLGIQAGDEVVLQGATCSVMVNAVLRNGATPVYADIDPETFGSSEAAIEKVLSPKTKMVVAQHSFGIPCDIQPIVELTQMKGVFLLEDCALTLGSSINEVVCGNFGDAALFSTDHSKPLNTLTGGFIYTKDSELFKKIKKVQSKSGSLSVKKQKKLWSQLLFERKYTSPDRYGRMQLLSMLRAKFKCTTHPFLDEDFGIGSSTSYPYPAKIPTFLAALGMFELERWERTAKKRKELFQLLLKIIDEDSKKELPYVYFDSSRNIVPLRMVWAPENGTAVRSKLAKFVSTSWTWFMEPIIATSEPLDKFGYKEGCCPISEKIGSRMVNIPCNLPSKWVGVLQHNLESSEI